MPSSNSTVSRREPLCSSIASPPGSEPAGNLGTNSPPFRRSWGRTSTQAAIPTARLLGLKDSSVDSITAPPLSASSPSKGRYIPDDTLECLTALVTSSRRSDAITALAHHLAADYVIIFIVDPEIGVLLPAPGFPPTLPSGSEWREFVRSCHVGRAQRDSLPTPGGRGIAPAVGFGARDGSAVVALGGEPRLDAMEAVADLLPFVAAALRSEQLAAGATTEAIAERSEAEQMRVLASSLEAAQDQVRQALGETRRALEAREQFVAMASHELKTPLASLTLEVQLLERLFHRGAESPDRHLDEAIRRLKRQVARLSTLADDLLDVSLARVGVLKIRREDVDLAQLAENVVERFLDYARSRNVDLSLRIEAPVRGFWDPHRIDQVLSNVLSNAIKYGNRQPVDIVVGRSGDRALVAVRDRGSGIAEADLRRIFERFERVQHLSDPGGFGLGLNIASEIARLHGGRIDVESAVGQGTTFTIVLPLHEPPAAGSETNAAPPKVRD